MADEQPQEVTEAPTEGDRYPDLQHVVAIALEFEDWPEGHVDRFECRGFADGSATYRVWEARSDEYVGGFVSAEELQASS